MNYYAIASGYASMGGATTSDDFDAMATGSHSFGALAGVGPNASISRFGRVFIGDIEQSH
jgi:hypothetical protein